MQTDVYVYGSDDNKQMLRDLPLCGGSGCNTDVKYFLARYEIDNVLM